MIPDLDFSKLPNPYDFANPITDPNLFSGRHEEIREVQYYLDHAVAASRPINLAILGPRASGKTSFLNFIESEAKKRDFCVARIDLDEGDVVAQLPFFYKLFDAILFSVCSMNAYGGLRAKTYDSYRNIVDGLEVPEDKTFCPFFFPTQYAIAMSKGNASGTLSDIAFKQDLTNIRKEINRPIAVLFDESDVLIKSRVYLEKLRNIFMATPGFMVVLAGTPALFPVMDEIFSPIVRQFKKINVKDFTHAKDTEDCIKSPLKKIGVHVPDQLFEKETFFDIGEIHKLSGGRPYEIHLICHFLFRKMQKGLARRMELTIDVLDDVRKELETSQDVFVRPILTAIRSFEKTHLEALGLLCSCSGRATFDEIWFWEYVTRGNKRWTKDLLWQELNELVSEKIISTNDNIPTFLGDEFDRIYCKYWSKKRGVHLFITDLPFEVYLSISLDGYLGAKIRNLEPDRTIYEGIAEQPTITEIACNMASQEMDKNPFTANRTVAEFIYWASVTAQGDPTFEIALVTITTPTKTIWRLFRRGNSKNDEDQRPLTEISDALKQLSERANSLNGTISTQIFQLPVATLDLLIAKVRSSSYANLKEELRLQHYEALFNAYVKDQDIPGAIRHGQLAYAYKPSAALANNLGYLYLSQGNLTKAREFLSNGLLQDDATDWKALLLYNSAILALHEHNHDNAHAMLVECTTLAETSNTADIACLIVPSFADDDTGLIFTEVKNPHFLDTAHSTLQLVNDFKSKRFRD